MAEDKECAHPACKCRAREGSDYCSTYCEGVGKSPDLQCGCGHAECAGTGKL